MIRCDTRVQKKKAIRTEKEACPRSSWVSNNAGQLVAPGFGCQPAGFDVRVLAFGTAARQDSCGVSSAASPTRSDDAKSGEFADKTVTG